MYSHTSKHIRIPIKHIDLKLIPTNNSIHLIMKPARSHTNAHVHICNIFCYCFKKRNIIQVKIMKEKSF